jgi:hypothetical protein
MSVFDDNITNELPNERIKKWFLCKIKEQWDLCQQVYHEKGEREFCQSISTKKLYIYHHLVFLWVKQYKTQLEHLGVYSTRTEIKQRGNKFKVIIRFSLDPSCREHGFWSDKEVDIVESNWMIL